MDLVAEEEAEPRRRDGGGTTPPGVSESCSRDCISWRRWEQRGAGRCRGGRAASEAAADLSKGGQELFTQYEGAS